MLPLVFFAVLFGLAAAYLPLERREAVVAFFRGIADALLVIVGWVIAVAPIGVFALAVGLVLRTGTAGVEALALYILLLCALILITTGLLYLIAATAGRVPLARFARAAAPAQAVAFSSRSSMAALPAMLAARERLLLPPAASGLVLPLAVTTLRVSTPIMWAVAIPFLARLHGIELGYAPLALLVLAGILLSFSTPGLPSASLFLMSPFLPGLGIPVEALGIAIAADAIPDLLKGVLNVTGHLTATAIVTRNSTQAVILSEARDPAGIE
jgi:Na+/H+-dicarboxylate symporter